MSKLLKTHVFTFNPQVRGVERLTLITEIFATDDKGKIGINHKLTLGSDLNSASFNLHNLTLTPGVFRQLADELELAIREATR